MALKLENIHRSLSQQFCLSEIKNGSFSSNNFVISCNSCGLFTFSYGKLSIKFSDIVLTYYESEIMEIIFMLDHVEVGYFEI